MWIKMDTNLGSDWPHPWKNGEVHHCHDDMGQKLVDLNLAFQVDPPIKPEAPVKDQPKGKKKDVVKDQDEQLAAMIAAEEKAKAAAAPAQPAAPPAPPVQSAAPAPVTK